MRKAWNHREGIDVQLQGLEWGGKRKQSLYSPTRDSNFLESGVMLDVYSDAGDSKLGFGELLTANICMRFFCLTNRVKWALSIHFINEAMDSEKLIALKVTLRLLVAYIISILPFFSQRILIFFWAVTELKAYMTQLGVAIWLSSGQSKSCWVALPESFLKKEWDVSLFAFLLLPSWPLECGCDGCRGSSHLVTVRIKAMYGMKMVKQRGLWLPTQWLC